MATNIDKGLYSAPQGIEEEEGMGAEMDIPDFEIESDNITPLEDGGVEVTIGTALISTGDPEFEENLAEVLDEGILKTLSNDLLGLVDADINSRKDWAETYVKGLEVLGFKYEDRTEPWENACGVYSTVLAEAAIRFQAEAMSETFPAAGPVRTKIIGKETPEKAEAASRVQEDMNYELTERMVEYRPEHERLLYSLGLAGSAFKKVYFDPTLGRQVAIYISAEDVIVPYGASHIETAERVTHVMRKTENEIKKLQAAGFYREVDLGEPTPYHTDIEKKKAEESGYTMTEDDRYALYEIHADLIIEGAEDDDDEIARPYVVTIERGTGEILSIRRNWNPDDELKLKRQHFVHYVYVPGFGFYGLGLIHIIGGYARAGTSIIRQLVDAGTLSNLPGGLKARGLRVKGDDTPIAPGEFRDVDIPSGAIKDNIMMLPYKEPSQVLMGLLEKITTEARRLGAISDMNVSDMSANAPVGTTLAILERTLKPMAAVQARVHYAMKQEFKLLKVIIADYAPTEYAYTPERGENGARQQDYAMVDVIPVSDPNSSTMAQRVVQYQAVLQMAQTAPQIYDLPQLHRQMIEVLGVKNADKLIPTTEDAKPKDPVSENMAALISKPMKAFIYQDHEAHIAAHTSFIQDPVIAQTIGQNPQAQQIMASLQAHIAEHLGFHYRKQIEDTLGAPLTAPGEELPEDVEVQLSRLIADAGKQLAQQHTQEAAQAQAQQQAQDPIIQMQQQEIQIKGAEVERKKAKDAQDAKLAERKIKIDELKVVTDLQKHHGTTTSQEKQASNRNEIELLRAIQQSKSTKNDHTMKAAQILHTMQQANKPKGPIGE
jgi:hypothetical protein